MNYNFNNINKFIVAYKTIMGTLLIPLLNYRHLSVPESVECH